MKVFIVLLIYVCTVRSKPDINDETENIIFSSNRNKQEAEKRQIFDKWECSEDEKTKQQDLVMTSQMLREGENEIDRQVNQAENTILVLGNVGVGKSTFVQFIGGDLSKLNSVEAGKDIEQYYIEDGNKIGTSITESFTLYPEQLAIDSNSTFTDTPGFSDTRSERHEAVATYVMKKYLKNLKNIKIVLLVNYHSVQRGIYKNDFIDLLLSVSSFLNDVDKYKKSIVLIATKVPTTYKLIGSYVTSISDKKVIQNIGDYINGVKDSLQNKILNSYKETVKGKLKNVVKMIENLMELDGKGNYKKINIFRRPVKPGQLSTMDMFHKAKQSLRETIFNNIEYSPISEDEIGFTLSPKAIIYFNCLLWYINDNIVNMSSYIFMQIENHYNTMINNYTDTNELSVELSKLYKKLETLKNDLKVTNNYTEYTLVILKFITNENIVINKNENDNSNNVHEYISYLEQFTSTDRILSTLFWVEQMEPVLIRVKDNLSWNNFLIKIFEYFSSYEFQNKKSPFQDVHDFTDGKNDSLQIVLSNFDSSSLDFNVNQLSLQKEKILDLDSIVFFALEKNNITCDIDGNLFVYGNYIKISTINNYENIETYCGSNPISAIGLFAIDTVFIDADLDDDNFRGIDIIIAAPKWEIIGVRKINIDGFPGEDHFPLKAEDGKDLKESGKDGMPGLPGSSAGNFVGFGINFVNDDNLIISSIGGNGGNGQHGGHGTKGEPGKDGYRRDHLPILEKFKENWIYFFKDSLWRKNNFTKYKLDLPICSGNIETYTNEGECGIAGGHGGNGGIGGLGGYPGKINLFGKDKTPNFIINISGGNSGFPGIGGNGGRTGERGKTITCFKIKILQKAHSFHELPQSEETFWKCNNLMYSNLNCNESGTGLNGKSNYIAKGVIQPSKKTAYNFSKYFDNYISLLENENNKLMINKLQTFKSYIKELYKRVI